MEDWLAQQEMDIEYQQSGTMELLSDEQISAAFGEDFLNSLFTDDGNIPSPQWDFDYNVIEQFASSPHVSNNSSDNHHVSNNNGNNNDHDSKNNSNIDHDSMNNINNDHDSNTTNNNDVESNNSNNNVHDNNNNKDNIASTKVDISDQLQDKEETNKKHATSGGAKRKKRQPSQIQDHIIAERKRRELLGQLFISLSALVPGLKKVDKTSVLGETIKYVKQLQERVKVLEEVAAKRTVESIAIIKKSRLIVNNNNDGGDDISFSSTVDHQSLSGSGGSSREVDYLSNSLPEIELKLSGKALLLRIHYEEQKDILPTVLAELNQNGMSVTNCSVTPFNNIAVDISIVAQIMGSHDFNVKEFIRSLCCALQLKSHQCHVSGADDHSS